MSKALKQAEYYQFVKYIATPLPFRNIKTQSQFQIEYMVSGDTLARWKKDSNFWDDVKREVKEWAKEQTPQVLGELLALCLVHKNINAIRIWLQYVRFNDDPLYEDNKMPTSLAEIIEEADKKLREQQRALDVDPNTFDKDGYNY